MQRIVPAAEANRRFSELLRQVKDGDTVTVTSRGRPVARILPVGSEPAPDAEKQRRKEAVSKLLKRLNDEPARNLGKFNRSWGYEE